MKIEEKAVEAKNSGIENGSREVGRETRSQKVVNEVFLGSDSC
jgi:hypothetical protein